MNNLNYFYSILFYTDVNLEKFSGVDIMHPKAFHLMTFHPNYISPHDMIHSNDNSSQFNFDKKTTFLCIQYLTLQPLICIHLNYFNHLSCKCNLR